MNELTESEIADSMVCAFEDGELDRDELERHWPAVVAERERVGRMLSADDVRAVISRDRQSSK